MSMSGDVYHQVPEVKQIVWFIFFAMTAFRHVHYARKLMHFVAHVNGVAFAKRHMYMYTCMHTHTHSRTHTGMHTYREADQQ
jgi:hypothetical protein